MFVNRATALNNRGQAFVELALVMPVFVFLIIGAAEIGRLAYASVEVSNAARAGVSYGAQNHATAADTTHIQLAATQDAPDVTSLTAQATQTCSCANGTTLTSITCSSAGTTCVTPSHIVVYLQVNTTAPVNTLFNFPGIPATVTLRGQAIMRVEQ